VLRDRSTEVFWRFDGQRRSTVWSGADPREGINPIEAQISMSAQVSGGGILLCSNWQRVIKSVTVRSPGGDGQSHWSMAARYPLHRRNQAKAEMYGAGGDVESEWVLIVPLWGTPRGGVMAPMCHQGFGPRIGGPPAPRAGGKREREYGERSRKTP
jgi:hypothetical protein